MKELQLLQPQMLMASDGLKGRDEVPIESLTGRGRWNGLVWFSDASSSTTLKPIYKETSQGRTKSLGPGSKERQRPPNRFNPA